MKKYILIGLLSAASCLHAQSVAEQLSQLEDEARTARIQAVTDRFEAERKAQQDAEMESLRASGAKLDAELQQAEMLRLQQATLALMQQAAASNDKNK